MMYPRDRSAQDTANCHNVNRQHFQTSLGAAQRDPKRQAPRVHQREEREEHEKPK